MIKKLYKPELRLIGIKTDCVIFEIERTALVSKVNDMNRSKQLSNGHWTASGHYQYSDTIELMFPRIKEMDYNNNDIVSLQTILQNPYKSIQTSAPSKDPPNTDDEQMKIDLRTKWLQSRTRVFGKQDTLDARISHLQGLFGALITGLGGSGKSYLMQNYAKRQISNGKRIGVLSFQGSVCEMWKRWAIKEKVELLFCQTIDSFFGRVYSPTGMKSMHGQAIPTSDIDEIIVDEFSQLGEEYWALLAEMVKSANDMDHILRTWLIGDNNQHEAIAEIVYNPLTTQVAHYIADGNLIRLKYNEQYARSTATNHKWLKYLIQTKRLHPELFEKDENGNYIHEDNELVNNRHITRFRKEVNKYGCNNINKQKAQSNQKQNNYISVGDEIICTLSFESESKLKVFNSQVYTAKQIDNGKVLVDIYAANRLVQEWFPINYKSKSVFELNIAQTGFKVQGQSIDEPYTIHDSNKMSFEAIFTAISRATNHKYIFFSEIESVQDKVFTSAYNHQNSVFGMYIPATLKEYDEINYRLRNSNIFVHPRAKPQPQIIKRVLYKITDSQTNTAYVGITEFKAPSFRNKEFRHQFKQMKTKEEVNELITNYSMQNRLDGHIKDKDCIVAKEMKQPEINKYYPNENSLIVGELSTAKKIEQAHIRSDLRENNVINVDVRNEMPTNVIEMKESIASEEEIIANKMKTLIEEAYNGIHPVKRGFRLKNIKIVKALKGYGSRSREISRANETALKEDIKKAVLTIMFDKESNKQENINLYDTIVSQL